MPQDFTLINVLRLNAGINPNDGKEVNLKKLCDYYHTNEQMLRDGLKMQNINLEDVVCGQNNTMTTDADILAKIFQSIGQIMLNQLHISLISS